MQKLLITGYRCLPLTPVPIALTWAPSCASHICPGFQGCSSTVAIELYQDRKVEAVTKYHSEVVASNFYESMKVAGKAG
uniref:Putative secreted protein n=1 Tax=Ixodes ricinus TaxID=34613 RepID=A0A6B0U3X7_IXORI